MKTSALSYANPNSSKVAYYIKGSTFCRFNPSQRQNEKWLIRDKAILS